MPDLPDLPPEILARLAYPKPFDMEQDEVLVKHQWRLDCHRIAVLSRTCQKLYSIFNPLLYRSFFLTYSGMTPGAKLVRTITNNPELGKHVKNLGLNLFLSTQPYNVTGNMATAGLISNVENHFFSYIQDLKQLVIRCYTDEALPLDFQELTHALIEYDARTRFMSMNQDIITRLLLAPKLQELVLSGICIPEGQQLISLEPGVSNISALSIGVEFISSDMLSVILRLPRCLTSFEFRCAYLNPRTVGFLKYEDVGAATKPHRGNLETIRLLLPDDRFDVIPGFYIFGDLSFRDYTRLTTLMMAPEMFLGWRLCDHVDDYPLMRTQYLPSNTFRQPITFVECLPDQLEHLTLYIEPYQRRRNGDGYAFDVLQGVINEERLHDLKSIHLVAYAVPGDSAFCAMCRVESLQPGVVPSSLKRSTMDQIQEMCQEAGIRFECDEALLEDGVNPTGEAVDLPTAEQTN